MMCWSWRINCKERLPIGCDYPIKKRAAKLRSILKEERLLTKTSSLGGRGAEHPVLITTFRMCLTHVVQPM